jgi:protocatechuate 3,4-dioxygenase beta subunit
MTRPLESGMSIARLATVFITFAVLAARPDAEPQVDSAATIVVRGRVLSADDNPRPLPNARITIAGGAGDPVFTTGQGEFSVRIPVAASLRIAKAGFAPALVPPASFADGNVQVRLIRGAVVTGVVVDELGFPANDVRVHVRWAGPAGAAPGATDYFAETDDAGEYRVGSLAPGSYTINSEPPLPLIPDTGFPGVFGEMETRMREMRLRSGAQAQALSEVVRVELRAGEEMPVALIHRRRAVSPPDAPIAGAVAGVVLDEFAEPVEGVAVRLWRVRFFEDRPVAEPTVLERRTDDRGQFRLVYVPPGRYLLAATDDQGAFAPVYFPGTTSAANAVPLSIAHREEAAGIAVTFTRTREARVAGVALDPRGLPLRGSVTLVASHRAGGTALPARLARTDEAGSFEFRNIPPGEYVLRATAPSDGGMRMQTLEAFGAQFVTVAGSDVRDVTLATSATATISGRIVVDGDRSDASRGEFFVTAHPEGDGGPTGRWSFEGRFTPDGFFQLRGLAGTLRLAATTPPGWWVKSIDVGGVDALHEPVRFGGPDDGRDDVTVVVAAGAAALSGRVTGEAGQPAPDYRVVVFSSDARRWFGRSPYVRITGGPDNDGGFTIGNLPPGDYLAIALDTIEGDGDAGEWQNPDVLSRLATDATRVTLAQGQRGAVSLRLVRWNR